MKTVLITGSSGFIGSHLELFLKQTQSFNILCYDKENSPEDLDTFVKATDFIFHLAGSNRPVDDSEYNTVNIKLTDTLIELLIKHKKNIPIFFSSSIKATESSAYGKSKLAAENLLIQWANTTDNTAYICRFPNIFGKWVKPNYNSVVATFCHNIAHDLPITIHSPHTVVPLLHIDEVMHYCLAALKGSLTISSEGLVDICPTVHITLKELADKLYRFKDNRNSLIMPSLKTSFDKKLYSTFLSYLDPNTLNYTLLTHSDTRGSLSEIIKSCSFGQIFVSKTKPGITRGNHWHHSKVEKFVVISGDATIYLRHLLSSEVITYSVTGEQPQVIDIPPGFTHSITNTGSTELITLFWSNEIFDSTTPDTFYEEVLKI